MLEIERIMSSKRVCFAEGASTTKAGIQKTMTDIAKKIKNTFQDSEAKLKTEEDHAEGKPSSETLNKAKVKTRDALK